MKKHKSNKPIEKKSSNSKAEVFVLPPELLAKLGINLGKVQNEEVQPPETCLPQGCAQNTNSTPNSLPEIRNTTSITETASLMKESVFLSPTFLQSGLHEVLDEEYGDESVGKNDMIPNKDSKNSINIDGENISSGEVITPQLLNDKVVRTNTAPGILMNHLIDIGPHDLIEEYQVENQDGNLILTGVTHSNTINGTNYNSKTKVATQVDEHSDEAYLSDCSNGRSGLSPERAQSDLKPKLQYNIRRKSEQLVVDHSQLIELKDLLSPVPVNSVVTEEEIYNDLNVDVIDNESKMFSLDQNITEQAVIISCNSNTADNILLSNFPEKIVSSVPIAQNDQNNSEVQIGKFELNTNNDSQHIQKHNNQTQNRVLLDSESAQCLKNYESESKASNNVEKSLNESLSNIQGTNKYNLCNHSVDIKHSGYDENKLQKSDFANKTKQQEIPATNIFENNDRDERSNDKEIDSQDRVKEVALSKIARGNNINLRNNHKDKNKILSMKKFELIKSNLHNQEIDNPGDKFIQNDNKACNNEKLLKTYQRTTRRKQIPVIIPKPDKVVTDMFQLSCTDNILGTKVGALKRQNEFCICNDFGYLAYYDCEMLYEHIHFWNHKNIICDPEIIYSIYNENHSFSKQIFDCIEDEHDEIKTSQDNICWNEMMSANKSKSVKSAASNSEISKDSSSSSEQKSLLDKSVPSTNLIEIKTAKSSNNIIICKSVQCRKRSFIEVNQLNEKNESGAKKNIKCGVCNQLMSDVDWETHKESAHNFMAWKAGEKTVIHSAPCSEPSNSAISQKIFTNSDTDLPLVPAHTHLKSVTQKKKLIPKNKPKNKNVDVSLMTTELGIDVSQSIVEYTNLKNSSQSNIINNKTDLTDSKSSEETTCLCSTKNISNTNITRKSDDVEKDVFSLENVGLSTLDNSLHSGDINESAQVNNQSIIAHKKSIEFPRLTSNTSLDTSCDILLSPIILTNSDNSFRPKSSMRVSQIEPGEPIESMVFTINDKNLTTENKKISSEPTRFAIRKHDLPDFSVKSSENQTSLKTKRSADLIEKSIDVEHTDTPKKSTEITLRTENKTAMKSNKSIADMNTNKKTKIAKSGEPSNKSIIIDLDESSSISTNTTVEESQFSLDSPKYANPKNDIKSKTPKGSKTDEKTTENSSSGNSNLPKHTSLDPNVSSKKTSKLKIDDSLKLPTPSYQCKGKLLKHNVSAETSSLPKRTADSDDTQFSKSFKKSSITVPHRTLDINTETIVSKQGNGSSKKSNKDPYLENVERHTALENAESKTSNSEQTTQKIVEVCNDATGYHNSTIDCPSKYTNMDSNKATDSQTKYNKMKGPHTLPESKLSEKQSSIKDTLPIVTNSIVMENTIITLDNSFKCGVCTKSIEASQWIDHICKEHNYLAWRDGEPALDLEDSEAVRQHLQAIVKQHDGLICSKCGLVRKFAKPFLRHLRNCNDNEKNSMDISTASDFNSTQEVNDDSLLTARPRKSRQKKSLVGPPVTCGVCNKTIELTAWYQHIRIEHKYLAWRDGDTPLDLKDEDQVKSHLNLISKQYGGLYCSKCDAKWTYVKKYLVHEKICNSANTSASSADLDTTHDPEDDSPLSTVKSRKSQQKKSRIIPPITCGVCKKTMEHTAWYEHIRVEHKYMAWRDGDTPLNVDDEDQVKSHLNYISKHYGGLVCHKCGSRWSYVKKYLVHLNLCEQNLIMNPPVEGKVEVEIKPIVKCGVCKLDVEGKEWINHIHQEHQYMAWVEGSEPLDAEDPEQIREHLKKVLDIAGELICTNCGISRAYVKSFEQHVRMCKNTGYSMKINQPTVDKSKYECGICHEIGDRNLWKDHVMANHYNIGWIVGELPINLRNPYAVEKYLKEYQKKFSLTCKHCKATRASYYGFYAHIMTCGKSSAELELVHDVCDICSNKYLCIYKNQHLAMHREQVAKQEMKVLKAQKVANELEKLRQEKDAQALGKTRSTRKAKKVNTSIVDETPECRCGAIFDNVEQLSEHQCEHKQRNDDDGSDVSVKMEPESEAETIDSDVDSNDEATDPKKRKRVRVSETLSKINRMCYRVNNYLSYLVNGFKDFCNLHYTANNLFNEWRDSEYVEVPKDEMGKYLPSMKESCKVRFGDSDDQEWLTYQRFESKKVTGYSLFTGGSIQCISWVPHNIADETLGNFLAVSTHRGPDVPRVGPDELPVHPGLVQIWDFQQFNFLPKCKLGLAHEYGIVWSMAWCPSGARDLLPNGCSEADIPTFRLGLLAIACSNGSAYILSVPYPPPETDSDELVMYKMKPVAELRLSMSPERRVYQATSINWSSQKGHDVIIVGYSNGTTALYDLNTESRFLKAVENNVLVYYPFQDKHSESSSITGVEIWPSANDSYTIGGHCSTSINGGTMCSWPSTAPSVRSHLPISSCYYSPLWPAVLLAGDASFTHKSVTEMEWWGGGRRLGAARSGAGCARCGGLAACAAPAVRLLRAHPCYPEVKKQIVATMLMLPIGQKRKRKVNDDLSIVVEPLTYDDAVRKYGLEFTLISKNEQFQAQKVCSEYELTPDQFPLSDIVAAEFCPSARFHEKLTVATHSGLIFVING